MSEPLLPPLEHVEAHPETPEEYAKRIKRLELAVEKLAAQPSAQEVIERIDKLRGDSDKLTEVIKGLGKLEKQIVQQEITSFSRSYRFKRWAYVMTVVLLAVIVSFGFNRKQQQVACIQRNQDNQAIVAILHDFFPPGKPIPPSASITQAELDAFFSGKADVNCSVFSNPFSGPSTDGS